MLASGPHPCSGPVERGCWPISAPGRSALLPKSPLEETKLVPLYSLLFLQKMVKAQSSSFRAKQMHTGEPSSPVQGALVQPKPPFSRGSRAVVQLPAWRLQTAPCPEPAFRVRASEASLPISPLVTTRPCALAET